MLLLPEYVRLFKGHTRRVDGILPDPFDQNYVYSYSSDNSIFKWNITSGERELIFQTKNELKSIRFLDTSLLVLEDHSLKLVDLGTRKEKILYKSDILFNEMEIVKLESSLPIIAIGTNIGKILLLSGKSFKKDELITVDSGVLTALKVININSSIYLAIGSIKGKIILIDPITKTKIYHSDFIVDEEIHILEWDKSKSFMFIGGQKGTIYCFALTISNEKLFLTLNYQLKGHSQAITALNHDLYFSYHSILWSASLDETVRAWILDNNPKEILYFRPLSYAVTCFLILSTNEIQNTKTDLFSRKLLIGSSDYTLRLWNVGILNYFPQMWGLRSALLEKWNSWQVDLPNREFPYLFKSVLNNIDSIINQLFSQLREQIIVQSRSLVDHQWRKTVNEFEQIFSSSVIKVNAEDSEINKLLISFSKQFASMDEGLSQYLHEQMLGEFTRYINEYSNNFTETFITKFQTNLIDISKTLIIDSKVIASANDLLEWFYAELKLILIHDLDQWVNNLKILIEPVRTKILQDWVVKNKDSINSKLNNKEIDFQNQIQEKWLELLKQELYERLKRLKERQGDKVSSVLDFIKEFKKLDNRFIYLLDLASQLNLFPSLIYQELVRLLEKDEINGMLLDDQRGYYYVNLSEKILLQRKNKLNSRIEALSRLNPKKHEQETKKLVEDYQEFWEWVKAYNIHQYDAEIQQKLDFLQIKH